MAVVVGEVTSLTGNDAPAEGLAAVVVVAAAVLRRDDRRTNLVAEAAVVRCGVPRRPATWPRTRAALQSTASATAAARVAGPGRSCPPPTPSTWPPRWRIP